jgi:hypothetical protein
MIEWGTLPYLSSDGFERLSLQMQSTSCLGTLYTNTLGLQ